MSFDLNGSVQKLVAGVDKLSKTLDNSKVADAPAASAAPPAPSTSQSQNIQNSEKQGQEAKKQSKASTRCMLDLIIAAYAALFVMVGFLGHSLSGIFFGIGALFVCVAFLARAAQWKSIDALAKRYIVFLSNNPEATVHDLAVSMRTDPGTVREQFALLAKRGLLMDVVVDEQSGKILIGTDIFEMNSISRSSIAVVEVECKGCGARKKVKVGSRTTCDHCGGELVG